MLTEGTVRAARALIPDDDDEELIEKAKANRKLRLASQKEVETEFKKSGGFAEGEVCPTGGTNAARCSACAVHDNLTPRTL